MGLFSMPNVGFVSSNLTTLTGYITTIIKYLNLHRAALNAESNQRDSIMSKITALAEKEDLAYILGDVDSLMTESSEGLRRIAEIVQNLKSFARPDHSESSDVNINDCIKSTLKIVWNELKYKCEVQSDFGTLPLIHCYPGQINQVIMNLLVNAAHAIPEKGIITIKTSASNSELVICVSDTGVGIPKKNIPKLFDPFFTTKPAGQGTGLGLSISYGIVQKHGGRIDVESTVGKGSTFTVYLPIQREGTV
ncbi:MAG: hypothetical protein HQM16_17940 [Deltaproteobacteria bacterium]|nr:hypothetical protein [Deltaproteobacteria bacterium]